jgi:hypothetical protein
MKIIPPPKVTDAVREMMALPFCVVDPCGNFTAGYATKAEADAGCKEMNGYAREAYWQVVAK